jgi:tetratricopeptide (TPR) repeat protein
MKAFSSLLFLALSVSLFIWYINPTYKEITKIRSHIEEYDEAIERANQALQKNNDLLAEYNTIRNDEPKLKKLLPDYVDSIRLIIDINAIAVRYGTAIKNIQIKSDAASSKQGTIGPDTQPYGTLGLSFTVALPYEQYLKFLSDLERSLPLLDVSSIGFKPTDNGAAYDYSINVNTYWLK